MTPASTSIYSQNSYTENLTEIIVNASAGLYEKNVKEFTNDAMTNAATWTNSNNKHAILNNGIRLYNITTIGFDGTLKGNNTIWSEPLQDNVTQPPSLGFALPSSTSEQIGRT